MRCGTITCDCGKVAYVESNKMFINCIDCNKKIDISGLMEMEESEEADDA